MPVTAPYNTKKFYWGSLTPILGLSSVNLYSKPLDSLSSDIALKAGIDGAFNFYHYVNPAYKGKAYGTKYVQVGMSFVYSRPEDAEKNKYFTYADSTSTSKKNRQATITEAYDSAEYSRLFTYKIHCDYYQFLNKANTVGLHLGSDYLVRYKTDAGKFGTGDMNFRAGLVFSLPSCTGDCDEDKKKSLANFELLFTTDNLLGAYRDD